MRRKVSGSNSTSASMIMTASAQFSARISLMPWLSVWALPWPPFSRRRWNTAPGYCAIFSRMTSGVWSVLASSTT